MKKIWRIARNTMCAAGIVMGFCAAGTADFSAAIRTATPETMWRTLFIAAALMLPTLLHEIRKSRRENA